MALSNGSYTDNGPLVFLSPRSKTKDKDGKETELAKPYFEVSRVNDEGNIAKTDETCTVVSGDLVGIKFKTREYQGKKTARVVLYIRDNNTDSAGSLRETYSLDFTHRMASRGLFNAMLSLEDPKNVAVSIYRSKRGFESFGLDQNGEKVPWKYELADLPKAEQIKDKKGEVVKTDFSDVDAFFEAELKALAEKFGFNTGDKNEKSAETPAPVTTPKPAAKTTAKPAAKPASKPVETPAEGTGDEDVPF